MRYLSYILLTLILAGCTPENSFRRENSKNKKPVFPLNVLVECVDLSENATVVSSKKDEIILLVYEEKQDTTGIPVLIESKYYEFDSLNTKYSFSVPPFYRFAKNIVFVLIEMDTEKNKEQLEPVVRVQFKELCKAFEKSDFKTLQLYLGDDDLLGIQKCTFPSNESRGKKKLVIKGNLLLDKYKYTITL